MFQYQITFLFSIFAEKVMDFSDFISLLIVEKYGKDYMKFSYIIEMWKGMILQIPVKILKHIFQVSTRQVLVPKAQSIVLKGQFYILEKL